MRVQNLVIFLRIFIWFLSFFPGHQVLNLYWYILKWPSLFKILDHIFNIFISPEPVSNVASTATVIPTLWFVLKLDPIVLAYMLLDDWIFMFPFSFTLYRTIGFGTTFQRFFWLIGFPQFFQYSLITFSGFGLLWSCPYPSNPRLLQKFLTLSLLRSMVVTMLR